MMTMQSAEYLLPKSLPSSEKLMPNGNEDAKLMPNGNEDAKLMPNGNEDAKLMPNGNELKVTNPPTLFDALNALGTISLIIKDTNLPISKTNMMAKKIERICTGHQFAEIRDKAHKFCELTDDDNRKNLAQTIFQELDTIIEEWFKRIDPNTPRTKNSLKDR